MLQSHQKGKADSLQDTFLVQCVFYLLQLHYLGFKYIKQVKMAHHTCYRNKKEDHYLIQQSYVILMS